MDITREGTIAILIKVEMLLAKNELIGTILSAPVVQWWCASGETVVHQWYEGGAPVLQWWCDSGATVPLSC
jgi:hypothetical protein